MNAIVATALDDEELEGTGSVSGPAALSSLERIFCDVFVANGGDGKAAAMAAGADEAKAAVQACRWLCKRRVADHIHRLCQRLVHASLPIAIRALMDIAADETAQRKDRIKAATSLLEHGGMAAPKGGVSVNVGVQVNGQQAQQLISSVWDAKAKRLSDIPSAMPDTLREDIQAIEAEVEHLAGDPPGGIAIKGPLAGTGPLPVPSPAIVPQSGVSQPDPTAAFRAAFNDDDHSQGDDDATDL